MPLVRNFYNETYYDKVQKKRVDTPPSESYNLFIDKSDYGAAYGGAVSDRLKYSRYIYSQMYLSYRQGGQVVRPLFFDNPQDYQAYEHSDSSFMLGEAIMVSPVLTQGVKGGDSYNSYFPKGKWYDLNSELDPLIIDTSAGGEYVNTVKASWAHTNLHLKAGKIIPFQKNKDGFKQTKLLETKHKMGFIIYRDEAKKYAEGHTLVDDGISQLSYANNDFTLWKLRYADKSINFWVQYGNQQYTPKDQLIDTLEYIDIVDAEDLADTNFACYMGIGLTPVDLIPDYNPGTKTL